MASQSYRGLSYVASRLWPLSTPPRNIYVASSLSNQGEAARFSLLLHDAGFNVTSRWLRNNFSRKPLIDDFVEQLVKDNSLTEAEKARWESWKDYEVNWGRQDLEDLAAADTLVILADHPSSKGGYHVELGYFIGAGKDNIIVVGNRPNVFYWTDTVRWKVNSDLLIDWLKAQKEPDKVDGREHA